MDFSDSMEYLDQDYNDTFDENIYEDSEENSDEDTDEGFRHHKHHKCHHTKSNICCPCMMCPMMYMYPMMYNQNNVKGCYRKHHSHDHDYNYDNDYNYNHNYYPPRPPIYPPYWFYMLNWNKRPWWHR